jgi:S1-C subfamily serine protease
MKAFFYIAKWTAYLFFVIGVIALIHAVIGGSIPYMIGFAIVVPLLSEIVRVAEKYGTAEQPRD